MLFACHNARTDEVLLLMTSSKIPYQRHLRTRIVFVRTQQCQLVVRVLSVAGLLGRQVVHARRIHFAPLVVFRGRPLLQLNLLVQSEVEEQDEHLLQIDIYQEDVLDDEFPRDCLRGVVEPCAVDSSVERDQHDWLDYVAKENAREVAPA